MKHKGESQKQITNIHTCLCNLLPVDKSIHFLKYRIILQKSKIFTIFLDIIEFCFNFWYHQVVLVYKTFCLPLIILPLHVCAMCRIIVWLSSVHKYEKSMEYEKVWIDYIL